MYRADGEPGSPHEAEQRAPDASEHPGSRPEIKRGVKVQKPTTLNKAIAETAAIGEANAKATAARTKTYDVSSQLAEMRAMIQSNPIHTDQRLHTQSDQRRDTHVVNARSNRNVFNWRLNALWL